jgi:outer membrane protein OmpA-like peptidoglycan-associated protein
MKNLITAFAWALPVLIGAGCTQPRPVPQAAIQVQVSSDPGKAALFLAGRAIGEAPRSLEVASVEDLLTMTATLNNEEVVEKRVRFLSQRQAEVSFVFGAGRSTMARTLGLPKILVFDYGAGVTFAVSQSTLKAEFLPLLERQAGVLKSHFQGLDLYVCGHTDSTGAQDRNLSLSLDRARAVATDLAGRGIPTERMKVQGFGSQYPVTGNETDQGRALNRRTELILPQ